MKVGRSLLERAIEYCGLLTPGSEIIDDTDGEYVGPFRHLLGAVLYRRGLYLDRREDRYVVTRTPPWLRRRLEGPVVIELAQPTGFAAVMPRGARA